MEPSDAKFCHPYDPYQIQLEFMRALYRCIDEGKVGIFESPTGTGKSLSLICGALTWLRDYKRSAFDEAFAEAPKDWLARAEIDLRRKEILREREEVEQKLANLGEQETRRKQRQEDARILKRARVDEGLSKSLDDDEFVLDDYNSDDGKSIRAQNASGLSFETQALLEKLKPPAEHENEDSSNLEVQVIFCSRTHSQLTQFVHELRRVKPPSSIRKNSSDVPHSGESIKHLPLGSRKNLCINEMVSQLNPTTAINERCLELQKPGTAKDKKCKYLPTKEDQEVIESFRDLAIARIRDIEDIATLGKESHICPYYASRSAITSSELLTLPYPLLLQKSAREALGVSVKGNVIVIDEAHNLMDAIADAFSAATRLTHLKLATEQLIAYVQRFKNKLKGKNRVYITQVIRVLNSITTSLDDMSPTLKQQEVEVTAAQLMSGKGVDQVRPHKLVQYIHESKLAYKVEGYTNSQAAGSKLVQPKGTLLQFQSFLTVLMNPAAEGRFFASRQDGEIGVRYVLLDPREHFKDIVEDARAVILAGGTMSPMSDYANYLFSYLPPGRLQTFSFAHVIPPSNMYVRAVTQGPTGKEVEFTFDKRGNDDVVRELGELLIRTCRSVPDGIVAFFPSYDYLAQVLQTWKKGSIYESLQKHKQIFEESKGVQVDELLREYTQAIDKGKGGLILSVVGGKLSEGINFSDKLGRAVVAIGLPFPNTNSGEWKAKIEHVESMKIKELRDVGCPEGESKAQAKAAGRDFYENACMRAVNQSIGRAIRHKNDYAAILLVDRRFSIERIARKLPGWIQGSMTSKASIWDDVEAGLRNFFSTKQ